MRRLTKPNRLPMAGTVLVATILAGACSQPDNTLEVQRNTAGSPQVQAKQASPQVMAKAASEDLPLVVDNEVPSSLPAAYDAALGQFVVHEWGTLTNVVASDGHLLPGLHHEEDDLPGFVADRMAQAQQTPMIVQQKMETPVTYFYSPQARSVRASVSFTKGIFTQWFPYVQVTRPSLYLTDPMDRNSIVDPWISSSTPLHPRCELRFASAVIDGLLDWGSIKILAPNDSPMLAGPTNGTNWNFARETRSNPLQVHVGNRDYHEKFLFYRGTGNFNLPLMATTSESAVKLTNSAISESMKDVFVLNVTSTGAGFSLAGDVAASQSLVAQIPAADMPLEVFKKSLGEALVKALLAQGLYADEARAMVATWERSYFLTPGARLLYLLPQTHTEKIIPLHIDPAPDVMLRVMVIRVELTTPELERSLDTLLTRLAVPATREEGRKGLLAHGRFAEPYLAGAIERAQTAASIAAGKALQEEIRAKYRWAPTALQ